MVLFRKSILILQNSEGEFQHLFKLIISSQAEYLKWNGPVMGKQFSVRI